jgi:hypothetical protein
VAGTSPKFFVTLCDYYSGSQSQAKNSDNIARHTVILLGRLAR